MAFYPMLAADRVKDVLEGMTASVMIGELGAMDGQNDVEPIGHGGDQIAQDRAAIFPDIWCSSTEANLEVRSMATKRCSVPSAV